MGMTPFSLFKVKQTKQKNPVNNVKINGLCLQPVHSKWLVKVYTCTNTGGDASHLQPVKAHFPNTYYIHTAGFTAVPDSVSYIQIDPF